MHLEHLTESIMKGYFSNLKKRVLMSYVENKTVLVFIPKMHVQWGTGTSETFLVSNGVRQGRSLSPVLF